MHRLGFLQTLGPGERDETRKTLRPREVRLAGQGGPVGLRPAEDDSYDYYDDYYGEFLCGFTVS
jgi:hypothetical protein